VSFWSRFRSREPKAPAEPEAPPQPRKPEPPPEQNDDRASRLQPLLALARGESASADAARLALQRATGTSDERPALEAVLGAHRRGVAPEPLRTLAARVAVDRGDLGQALLFLEHATGTDALMMAADIHEERAEVALALTLIERVLARDLDLPGARERHHRLKQKLGGPTQSEVVHAGATVLRADAPETSLRIVAEAGRGGAGTVFEAVDDVLGRRVALKVYHRPEDDRDKLENEAKMAVTLAGPGVVRIFDADLDRGTIVMEWLPAGALKRWLKDPKELLPLERWLVPLAETLARIHALGFVHGDLKPANVMFRTLDEPVLGDFGLARKTGEAVSGGSRGYMSPERLAGAPLASAEDCYAFGRILEDVLIAAGEDAPDLMRFRRIADRLLSPIDQRPPDAQAALSLLREGLPTEGVAS
jgi:serine/threonine-protein kinase